MASREKDILIADAEEDTRLALKDILESQGYRVAETEDGEQAVVALKNRAPDLLILRLDMPTLNGMEVLRQGRALYPDLLVVILAGPDSTELTLQAIREGAYDYFTTPFDKQELLATVERALEKQQFLKQIKDMK